MQRLLLLVEDTDSDAEALLRVARKLPLSAPGSLFQRGAYAQAPRPVLVLLDLHLPGIGGQEVLAQLEADPALRSLPVIIFSNLQDAARALEGFWFSAARLPGLEEPTG